MNGLGPLVRGLRRHLGGSLLLALLIAAGVLAHWLAPLSARLIVLDLLLTGLGVATLFLLWGRALESRQDELNAELADLHAAALEASSGPKLNELLQRFVEAAQRWSKARYAALAMYDESGAIRSFHSVGMSAEQIERIGRLPSGKGVLGQALAGRRPLRLDDIASHPTAVGFPASHPSMKGLLAVQVRGSSPSRGVLYMTDRKGGRRFTAAEERALERLAERAALAFDYLHYQEQRLRMALSEERLRLARDMHDGWMQVMAARLAQCETALVLTQQGKILHAQEELHALIDMLQDDAMDARALIFDLRRTNAATPLATALREHVNWLHDETGVAVEARIEATRPLPPEMELQVQLIAQEALVNVRKHAKAKNVRLEFGPLEDGFALTIEDDGVGLRLSGPGPALGLRFGILSMRERARSIGASLAIGAGPAGGTRVRAEFRPARAGEIQRTRSTDRAPR
jgi:signal transduction histidine kinase